MKQLPIAAAVALGLCAAMAGCDDEQTTLGSSLVTDHVEIVVDSSFTLSGSSVVAGPIQSRTTLQLLGSIYNDVYGSFSSTVATQFMAAERIDTVGVDPSLIDSVSLTLRIPRDGFVGDSLVPVGITVNPLTRALPSPIYSSFNPSDYYDPSSTLASGYYTLTGPAGKDGRRVISLQLPVAYGQSLFEAYKANPSLFQSPKAFTERFPGMFISTSFGSGRVAQIDSTVVTVHYRARSIDSETGETVLTPKSQAYMAATPEVVTNNNISFTPSASLVAHAAASPVIAAPAGYDVEARIPVDEIIAAYRSTGSAISVVNTLQLIIPVEEIGAAAGIAPPPYVLMVRKADRDRFFAESRLPDNTTSFYATYNSYTRRYEFDDMRSYLLAMLDKEGGPTEDDMQFIICPVTLGWENTSASAAYSYYYDYPSQQSAVVAAVTPYIQKPSMALLKLSDSKIYFTYSVQNLKK